MDYGRREEAIGAFQLPPTPLFFPDETSSRKICPLNSVSFECEDHGTAADVCVCDEGEMSPQCLGNITPQS